METCCSHTEARDLHQCQAVRTPTRPSMSESGFLHFSQGMSPGAHLGTAFGSKKQQLWLRGVHRGAWGHREDQKQAATPPAGSSWCRVRAEE